MLTKITAALVLSVGGGIAANEMLDTIKPEAEHDAAEAAFVLIAEASYISTELGETWESALADTVITARRNEAVSVEGTTLFWRHGDACLYAELPTRDTVVEVQSC
jgi:hypothetical protein